MKTGHTTIPPQEDSILVRHVFFVRAFLEAFIMKLLSSDEDHVSFVLSTFFFQN